MAWEGGGRDEQRWGADGQCSEFLTSFLYQKHLPDEHHKGLAQEQICQAPVRLKKFMENCISKNRFHSIQKGKY